MDGMGLCGIMAHFSLKTMLIQMKLQRLMKHSQGTPKTHALTHLKSTLIYTPYKNKRFKSFLMTVAVGQVQMHQSDKWNEMTRDSK